MSSENHIKNNWYVITGAASSGKTTLIKKLEENGYQVVHETARSYFDQEIAKGRNRDDIRGDDQKFQDKVLEMKIEIEKILPKDGVVFLDRGIPDTVAFCKLHNYPENDILKSSVKNCDYKKIFLLERLPYEIDYMRTESTEQQEFLLNYLEETYI